MVHGDTINTVWAKSDNYMYFSFGLAGGRCQIISSVIITLNMEILKYKYPDVHYTYTHQ